jgi:hypothetical protein
MVVLQIGVPSRQQRDLMTEEERNPNDETQQFIRDWGILIKYRDYLKSWKKLLSKMEKRLSRLKEKKQKSR